MTPTDGRKELLAASSNHASGRHLLRLQVDVRCSDCNATHTGRLIITIAATNENARQHLEESA